MPHQQQLALCCGRSAAPSRDRIGATLVSRALPSAVATACELRATLSPPEHRPHACDAPTSSSLHCAARAQQILPEITLVPPSDQLHACLLLRVHPRVPLHTVSDHHQCSNLQLCLLR